MHDVIAKILFNRKLLLDFAAPEAQEHLQCLIECIREMYSNNQRLRSDLEKTSIRADALRHRERVANTTAKTQKVHIFSASSCTSWKAEKLHFIQFEIRKKLKIKECSLF